MVQTVGIRGNHAQLWLIKYQGVQNWAKVDFLAGSNNETIQHTTLKLTMGEYLKRHYVIPSFIQIHDHNVLFCVDLTWNDPYTMGMVKDTSLNHAERNSM